MTKEALIKLIDRLADSVANRPTSGKVAVLLESIIDNGLTDEEIKRAYVAVRDSESPFWPTPGEFKARARTKSVPDIEMKILARSEAETILASILDRPELYGDYNPYTGRLYDRRRVEKIHGPAAGVAFAAVASRFRSPLDAEGRDLVFLRKEFVEAYVGSREHYGAAVTLTPPERQIMATRETKAVTGQSDEQPDDPRKGAEDAKRLDAMIRDVPAPSPPMTDRAFDERVALLKKQAEEAGRGV